MTPAGHSPGVIGQIVRLHAEYYAREWSFGLAFEAKVAGELSVFLAAFRHGLDYFAVERDDAGELLGTISLEGPLTGDGLAHLRWFITSDAARGRGLGRRLLVDALRHADQAGFQGIYLTTFAGLEAARRLYEEVGFRLVSEEPVDRWSGGVREQRFERTRSDVAQETQKASQ